MNSVKGAYRSGQQECFDTFFCIVAYKLCYTEQLQGQRPQDKPTSIIYFSTAGITPAAPFVGDVTILPPEAFTSLTAIA